jgi:paraquat-inducible protein B
LERNIDDFETIPYSFYSHTTLQMPSEIQARIAHTIDTAVDTRINPVTLAVNREVAALAIAEEASSKLIEGTIRDVGKNHMEELQKYNGKISLDLENKFNTLSMIQEACAGGIAKIEDSVSNE